MVDELRYPKAPRIPVCPFPYPAHTPRTSNRYSCVTVKIDQDLAKDAEKSIDAQMADLDDKGITPKFISVNKMGYEAMISLQYLLSGITSLPEKYHDVSIVFNPKQLNPVLVLSGPVDEFLYESEIR